MNDCLSAEDKLVLSKANDTIELSLKRCCPCFYGFLNEHESQLIKDKIYLDDNCVFWGGYDDSQRVIFGSNVSDNSDFPIVALKFTYKKEYKLSHSDFLGSLMALGIERSTIGDILVSDGETVVFIKTEIADYIRQQIVKIGRVGVKISDCDLSKVVYKSEFDMLSFTVASLRLDVFVSAVCSVSRDKAQRLINSDFVAVNHSIENNTSKTLNVDDVVTIRKYGKFVFTENNGLSKKGRVRILVKHLR